MVAEKRRDIGGETVGGVAVSQKGNARMDEKMCHKNKHKEDKRLAKKDYEETVRALKRIAEIWEILTDNEKKMMRIIKRALIQKERKLKEKLKEAC